MVAPISNLLSTTKKSMVFGEQLPFVMLLASLDGTADVA